VTESPPTSGSVTASHAYAAAGTYVITETVLDDGTGKATQTFTVTIVPAVGLPIRVDDNNANNNASNGSGNFQLSGTGAGPFFGWVTTANSNAFDGSEHVHAAANSDTADATWTYATPSTATVTKYTIYASWAAAPGNATNAAYKIFIDGVLAKTAVVDQTKTPSTAFLGNTLIQSLFTVALSAGSHNVKVVLSDLANGTVVADGIFDPPEPTADGGDAAPAVPTGELGLAQPPADTTATAAPTASLSAPFGGVPAATPTLLLAVSDLALIGNSNAPAIGSSPAAASPPSGGPPADIAALDKLFAATAAGHKVGEPAAMGTLDQLFAGGLDLTGHVDAPLPDGSAGDAF
jgi:hypothetical protein